MNKAFVYSRVGRSSGLELHTEGGIRFGEGGGMRMNRYMYHRRFGVHARGSCIKLDDLASYTHHLLSLHELRIGSFEATLGTGAQNQTSRRLRPVAFLRAGTVRAQRESPPETYSERLSFILAGP